MYGKLEFYDPVPVLLAQRAIEASGLLRLFPERVRRLRTGRLKAQREHRTAAIFAHGLASIVNSKVLVAPHEDTDFDFVVTWTDLDAGQLFTAVQLKEVAPEDLNPAHSLAAVLNGLGKYPKTDTILLVLLNRPIEETVNLETFPFKQLWLMWQSSGDSSKWTLLGDCTRTPQQYDFLYPCEA